MTDREKLAALIYKAAGRLVEEEAESLAYRLIAKGVVVREKGEWEETRLSAASYRRSYKKVSCSVCGKGNGIKQKPFCPNCGADMRKGENG